MDTISARFSTLKAVTRRQGAEMTYACFIDVPHFCMTGIHLSLMVGSWGITLGAFNEGKLVL